MAYITVSVAIQEGVTKEWQSEIHATTSELIRLVRRAAKGRDEGV